MDQSAVQPGGPMHLSPDAGWIERVRVGFRALAVLDENADDGVAGPTFAMAMDAESFVRFATRYQRSERGRELLRARPNLQLSQRDLEAMHTLPEGTLGHALAHYFREFAIAPFVSDYPVEGDVEYLCRRYREIHDVVHLVTGYRADPIGEIELQAFILGNLRMRSPWLVLIYAALVRPDGLPPIWRYADRLLAAYRRGRLSQDVGLLPHYERHWSSPLEEVRRHVGLVL